MDAWSDREGICVSGCVEDAWSGREERSVSGCVDGDWSGREETGVSGCVEYVLSSARERRGVFTSASKYTLP